MNEYSYEYSFQYSWKLCGFQYDGPRWKRWSFFKIGTIDAALLGIFPTQFREFVGNDTRYYIFVSKLGAFSQSGITQEGISKVAALTTDRFFHVFHTGIIPQRHGVHKKDGQFHSVKKNLFFKKKTIVFKSKILNQTLLECYEKCQKNRHANDTILKPYGRFKHFSK